MERCHKNDDIKLVEACISNDLAAWADFVKKYSALIYISIDNRLKKYGFKLARQELEDIRQNILSSIWKDKKLETVRNRNDISYWLSMVSGNTAVEYMRTKRRLEPVRPLSLFEKINEEELADIIPSDAKDPKDGALRNELSIKIDEAFESLAPKERLITKLSMLHGKKDREIAEILRLPRSTVSSHLRRAKEKLRKMLKDFV